MEKNWFESKTVWAGVVAALSGVLGMFNVVLDQVAIVDALASLGSMVAGLVAIYGRFVADKVIRIGNGNSDSAAD